MRSTGRASKRRGAEFLAKTAVGFLFIHLCVSAPLRESLHSILFSDD
jgi:hypothetical protein